MPPTELTNHHEEPAKNIPNDFMEAVVKWVETMEWLSKAKLISMENNYAFRFAVEFSPSQ